MAGSTRRSGLGGFRYYAPLGSDPDVVLSVRFPLQYHAGASKRIAVQAASVLGVVMLFICFGQYLLLRRTTNRIARSASCSSRTGSERRRCHTGQVAVSSPHGHLAVHSREGAHGRG